MNEQTKEEFREIIREELAPVKKDRKDAELVIWLLTGMAAGLVLGFMLAFFSLCWGLQ